MSSSDDILELLNQLENSSADDNLLKDAKDLFQFYNQQSQKIEEMRTETEKMKGDVEKVESLYPDFDISNDNTDIDELIEMHHEKERQEEKIESIQSYCDELQAKIQERENDLKEIRSRHQKLLDEIAERESLHENLSKSLENANVSYKEANQRLLSQHKDIENKDSMITQLKNDIEVQKQNIENEKSHLKFNTTFSKKKSIDLKKFNCSKVTGIEFTSLLDDSYDPDIFYITGVGRFLAKYNFTDAKQISKVDFPAEPNAIHLEPESSSIALSCSNDSTYIYNPIDLRLISTLNSHQKNITDNCWLTRNQLLTASKERSVQIYDVDQGRLLKTLMLPNPVNSICNLGNLNTFMIADDEGGIKIIDKSQENCIVNSLIHFEKSKRVQIDTMLPDVYYERLYALEKGSDCIYEIDIPNMKIINKLTHPSISHDNKFSCISTDQFSHFLVCGTTNGSIILFDLSGGVVVDDDDNDNVSVLKKKHDKSVICCKVGPNKLVSADSHDMILWN